MTVHEADFFEQVGWFGGLEPRELEDLRSRSVRSTHATGAIVFEPTANPRSVYLLESGSIRIYRLSSSGEEATLGYVSPREVFGELPGFGAFSRESFASAQSPSATWKVPVDVFRTLLVSHPSLMGEVTRQVAERMKRVETRVEDLILRDVRLRLASALIELSEHLGETTPDGRVLKVPLSQTQLGTLIGATRQSVNAAMAEFKTRGWVRQDRATITVTSPAGLRELLDPR